MLFMVDEFGYDHRVENYVDWPDLPILALGTFDYSQLICYLSWLKWIPCCDQTGTCI